MKNLVLMTLLGIFAISCQSVSKYTTYETVYANENLSLKVQGTDKVYFLNNKSKAYHGSSISSKELSADLQKAKNWMDKINSSGETGLNVKKSIRAGLWGPTVSMSGNLVIICFVDQRYPNLQPTDCTSLKEKELPEVISLLNNTGPLLNKINRKIALANELN